MNLSEQISYLNKSAGIKDSPEQHIAEHGESKTTALPAYKHCGKTVQMF